MKAGFPKACVVILNWNETERTLRCLASVRASDCADLRILVVDNGSQNAQALSARLEGQAELLRLPSNCGFSGGMNAGIAEALAGGADYVLLLNNDTEVPVDMVRTLVQTAEAQPALGILGPLVLPLPPAQSPVLGVGRIDFWTGTTPFDFTPPAGDSAKAELVHGCCFLVKREVFEKIGQLDESYFAYYEETDFCVRAARAGFGLAVTRLTHVFHEGSATTQKISGLQEFLMMRNRLRFVRKNGSRLQFWTATLFATCIYGPRRMLRSLLRGQVHPAAEVLRGWWSGLFTALDSGPIFR